MSKILSELKKIKVDDIRSYSGVRSVIRKTIREGELRARAAVEYEKVRTAWKVGRLTHEHILLNQNRAEYGKKVILRLSKDLAMSHSELGRMVEFSRAYPISATWRKLTWSHCKALLAVNDEKTRKLLTDRADQDNWTVEKTRLEIKKLKSSSKTTRSRKKTLESRIPNSLNVFRKRTIQKKVWIDLGFTNYLEPKTVKKKLKIVTDKDFTYEARVDRVVDGDTVWCLIDLGLGSMTRQKLRLRGINAPELDSPAGLRAKRYLARKLPAGTAMIVGTHKTDKYDRYLADLWLGDDYLNQRLIKAGHAQAV